MLTVVNNWGSLSSALEVVKYWAPTSGKALIQEPDEINGCGTVNSLPFAAQFLITTFSVSPETESTYDP